MTDKTAADGLPTLTDIAAVGKAIWWMVLIRGIAAILFGILAIAFPGATVFVLAILFAAYSLVDGVAAIIHAVRVRKSAKNWGWLLAQGIISVLTGLVVAAFPIIAGILGSLIVVYLIAFWSIFTGVAGFPAAHAMVDGSRKVWGYVVAALSVLFGLGLVIAAVVTPLSAVNALIVVIGAYAIVAGIMLIVLAVTVRSGARKVLAAA